MVGHIYFINMPYSDFTKSKGRPVLVYKEIDIAILYQTTTKIT